MHDQMNRPFGAVDVAANMKGAVPKAATQKILVALAEKGELTQKLYGKSSNWQRFGGSLTRYTGKTTFFVINQSKLDAVSPEKLAALEEEHGKLDEAHKLRANEIRVALNGKLLNVFSAYTRD